MGHPVALSYEADRLPPRTRIGHSGQVPPVWMRHEFPWLGLGFLHAVHVDAADGFEGELVRLKFKLVVLDGADMADELGFWVQVREAFDFPDYFGSNWDAFNDSFGDYELPKRLAVVWRHSDVFASRNLKVFGEAVAILHETFSALQGSQAIVVLTGRGPEFKLPY